LHTPFPSYEVFRQLSHGDQLLRGILGSDLIGFHIYDYVRHFLTSVLRSIGDDSKYGILNVDGRMVKADAFPIGIDFERFSTAPKGKETKNFLKNLKKYYKNQKIILSVDRLDYSKGIIKRLEAYEQLLANNKELQGKVTMIILAVPSRSDVDTYKELRDNIELYVSRINGLFSTINWSPINYQYKNTPFDELIALYRLADIALVTPLRDGMNLVAKEYVAANKDSSGVLILSEMAGAADELLEAVKINPNDTDSIEDAIKKALVMPIKEQKSRIKAMNYRISKYTVQKWGQDFIEELRDIKQVQKEKEMTHIDEEKINDIKSSFNKAKKRTILLDYDGTLVNLRKNHKSSIKPDKKLTSTLNNLVSLRNTEVYIISGRPHKLIQKWLGKIRNLNLIAEHGAWRKTKGKWSKSPESIDSYKKLILPIMEKITERTPGSDIEVKTTSIVWHYRMVPTELAYIRKMNLLRELHKVVDNSKLSIRQGSKIIEVKPVSVNKGKIVTKILSDRPSDFVLCLGDDYTDEDMFNVLPKSAYTIKVGYESTDARYWIRDVESVLDLLEGLGNKKRSVIKSIKPVVKKGLKTISAKK
ncbi:bifunctional alpha,alpha-trehalose-phosphate synthase (UDP-forming)/trehalose-phosphatase, partial [Candidatus Saccharibacteria bacterium]|nr:bifunctional alpha,alpha-trehalose-phosphate synthase (UDP-forming)/trehalose-phosphatase [Candidatus Saccharibacteria bacterium]